MQVSESQTIEITETMKIRRIGWSMCFIVILASVLYFSLVVLPNSTMPPFAAATAAALLVVLVGGMSLISLLYVLYIYRGAGVQRVFSISPEGIKIIVPRKPVFEIRWSEFDLIHLAKFSGSQNQKLYRYYFISNGVIYDEFLIEGSMHFSGRNCRAIAFQLKKYAENMKVQFVKGKRLKR